LRFVRILLLGYIALLCGASLHGQDTTLTSPRIITSGVRTTQLQNDGTFAVQGIRLVAPKNLIDPTVPIQIVDVTLQLVKNSVSVSGVFSNSIRVEINKAEFISATDSYSVTCYLANARKPIAAGTVSGSCVFEITAVAATKELRSEKASKTFAVTFSN